MANGGIDYFSKEVGAEPIDYFSEEVFGKTPKTDNLIKRAILSSRKAGVQGSFSSLPTSKDEVSDLAKIGFRSLVPQSAGLVGRGSEMVTGEKPEPELLAPKTDYGRRVEFESSLSTLPFAIQGIQQLAKTQSPKLSGLVTRVQEAFVPKYVRPQQASFGKALRTATRDAVSSGRAGVPEREVESILTDVDPKQMNARAKKVYNDLENLIFNQKKTARQSRILNKSGEPFQITEAPRIKKEPDVIDLRKAKTRLRNSMTKGEQSGKSYSESSREAKKLISRLDDSINSRLNTPEYRAAKGRYGQFATEKKTLEKFDPELSGKGVAGTARGERYLRKIKGATEAEIKALRNFEEQTGVKFVDEAINIQSKAERKKFLTNTFANTAVYGLLGGALGSLFVDRLTNALSGER